MIEIFRITYFWINIYKKMACFTTRVVEILFLNPYHIAYFKLSIDNWLKSHNSQHVDSHTSHTKLFPQCLNSLKKHEGQNRHKHATITNSY